MSLRFQPIQAATGSKDQASRLVFHESLLVAVLVHLMDEHGLEAGKSFLEVGFGRVADPNVPIFADHDEAQRWIISQLASHPRRSRAVTLRDVCSWQVSSPSLSSNQPCNFHGLTTSSST